MDTATNSAAKESTPSREDLPRAPHSVISLDAIVEARERLSGTVLRTPLVRLEGVATPAEIYLKLENLQPTSSFKVRGAGNAIHAADPKVLRKGVWTASAGNMALAAGWYARKLGLPCTVFVSDLVPAAKLERLERLGCKIATVPFEDWVQILITHRYESMEGLFIHPVSDPAVMAGNGTIGLEILEDLPDVDAVVMPFGLGGLCCGIGSAIRALEPAARVYACETDAAAPLAASLAAKQQVEVPYNPSFADAMGAPMLLQEMWPLARDLVDDSLVCPLAEVAHAVKVLAERARVMAEGAGAVALAAALSGQAGSGKIVCVVSGGNIDTDKFQRALAGEVP